MVDVVIFWFLSSVGRALARHARGHWFEPSRNHQLKHASLRLVCFFYAFLVIDLSLYSY